jgi:dihydrofolate synthase/folylpolyglutamate synthase
MLAEEAHAYLASLQPSTIRMGLERVVAALSSLGDPQRRFPSVHVAGTNGKGSTCAMLSSCLSTRFRTGFYSSPHLLRFNERIKINGEDIDDETLASRVSEVLARLGAEHSLTYFEFGTVLAFWHFAQEHVDIAVVETGLGGRLDATVTCQPLVTAITSIGFDHTELLGDTLPQIAQEKAGIVKRRIPVVAARQAPEVLAVLEKAAERAEAVLVVEGRDVTFRDRTYRGRTLDIEAVDLPLAGAHQLQNAAVALGCLELLRPQGFVLSAAELRAGISKVRWPGRFQILPGEPLLVLDGAHNPSGVDALCTALDARNESRDLGLVFGVFSDKDSDPMMRQLFPRARQLYLASLASPRGLAPKSYEALARQLCSQTAVFETVDEALSTALDAARPESMVLVAGSLHLVAEALATLERRFERMLSRIESSSPNQEDFSRGRLELASELRHGRPSLHPARFRRVVFGLWERFPDADWGPPGPLVHEIERWGGFEADLRASLERQPTFLAVSMVNRAMNVTDDAQQLSAWRECLKWMEHHPKASAWVQKAAGRYLSYQMSR